MRRRMTEEIGFRACFNIKRKMFGCNGIFAQSVNCTAAQSTKGERPKICGSMAFRIYDAMKQKCLRALELWQSCQCTAARKHRETATEGLRIRQCTAARKHGEAATEGLRKQGFLFVLNHKAKTLACNGVFSQSVNCAAV